MLCHLLFEPGWKPAALLERFAVTDLPVVDITPGVATVTPERRRMTLGELTGALDTQRREVFADEIPKIRQAAGLPETK